MSFLGFLTTHREKAGRTGLSKFVTVDIPVPLACLDRNTAENQCAVLRSAMARVPEVRAFQKEFPSQARVAVVDRFGANTRGEAYLRSHSGKCFTTVFGCEVHKTAGSLKKALVPQDDIISGVVNCALAQEGAGTTQTLRRIIQDIFEDSLQIVYGEPPQGRPLLHRKQVLDLFLPLESPTVNYHDRDQVYKVRNRKRRFILATLANGDIESESIVHYCGFQCCESPQATLYFFQRFVTWALVPGKLPVLSRKSWTGSTAAFEWSGLLEAHWNLMQRVILKFVGKPQRPLPEDREYGDVAAARLDPWPWPWPLILPAYLH